MNPYQLLQPGGEPAGIWVCARCLSCFGQVRDAKRRGSEFDQHNAEQCCAPTCPDCGIAVHRTYGRCDSCEKAHRKAHVARQIDAAVQVDTWNDWVYWRNWGTRDGFFESVEALLEWHGDHLQDADQPDPLPEFIFTCDEIPFPKFTTDGIVETVEDELGREDEPDGLDELQAALDAFTAANAGRKSYTPNYGRAVRVRPASAEEPTP